MTWFQDVNRHILESKSSNGIVRRFWRYTDSTVLSAKEKYFIRKASDI